MPGSSNLGLWNYIDDDVFEPDYPVSTAYSWMLRDNLAHLIDSQCQVRVSWMGKSTRNDHFSFPVGEDGFYAVEFPITVLSGSYLPGLRVASWLYSGGGNAVVGLYALRWTHEPLFPTGIALDADALWSFTHTTTNTSGEKFSDTTTTVRDARNSVNGRRSFAIEEGSVARTTEVRMARFEVALTTDSGSFAGGMLGLQIIEFPLWP